MADKIKVYRTYEFQDKDPVIAEIRGMIEKEKLLKKPGIVHELSGVSRATIHNWFYGETRCPRYSTVMAIASSLGYRSAFRHEEQIDVEAARKSAARWNERREAKKEAEKKRLIAARKAAKSNQTAHASGFNRA